MKIVNFTHKGRVGFATVFVSECQCALFTVSHCRGKWFRFNLWLSNHKVKVTKTLKTPFTCAIDEEDSIETLGASASA